MKALYIILALTLVLLIALVVVWLYQRKKAKAAAAEAEEPAGPGGDEISLLFREAVSAPKLLGVALIIGGFVLLHASTTVGTH